MLPPTGVDGRNATALGMKGGLTTPADIRMTLRQPWFARLDAVSKPVDAEKKPNRGAISDKRKSWLTAALHH